MAKTKRIKLLVTPLRYGQISCDLVAWQMFRTLGQKKQHKKRRTPKAEKKVSAEKEESESRRYKGGRCEWMREKNRYIRRVRVGEKQVYKKEIYFFGQFWDFMAVQFQGFKIQFCCQKNRRKLSYVGATRTNICVWRYGWDKEKESKKRINVMRGSDYTFC